MNCCWDPRSRGVVGGANSWCCGNSHLFPHRAVIIFVDVMETQAALRRTATKVGYAVLLCHALLVHVDTKGVAGIRGGGGGPVNK